MANGGPSVADWLAALARVACLPLDVLFPPLCTLCVQPPVPHRGCLICGGCLAALQLWNQPLCARCASPLAATAWETQACAACRTRKYHFVAATALGPYRGLLREAVLHAKRAEHEPIARAFGELLAANCQNRWPELPFDLIVPAPMHWRRRLRRGTHSAQVIAEAAAKVLQIPLARRLVRASRATQKQGMLTPRERFDNVRNAYQLRRPRILRGARILIVDDVMTTGATVSEVARTLRQGGAEAVSVAVLARGLRGISG
jgi:ComF family protein